jgi:hypothetical protein
MNDRHIATRTRLLIVLTISSISVCAMANDISSIPRANIPIPAIMTGIAWYSDGIHTSNVEIVQRLGKVRASW